MNCQDKPYRISRAHNCGITLVALVVTIVVLLILAGITIVYVFGDQGIFSKALEAKKQADLSRIEEKAWNIYNEYRIQEDRKEPTIQEIAEKLKQEGENIKEISTNEKEIVVNKEKIVIEFNSTETIQASIKDIGEENEISQYYVLLNGKYYQISLNEGIISIDRNESEISNEDIPKELNAISSDPTIATVSTNTVTNEITITALEKMGTATITIEYGKCTPKICTVEVIGTIPVNFQYEEKEYYKCNQIATINIQYETDARIDEKTVKANQTIKVVNEEGVNARISNIRNLEKESIIEIDVGNTTGEFFIQLEGIKDINGKIVSLKQSKKISVGTYMQRIVSEAKNVGTPIYLDYVPMNMFDDDLKTSWHCSGNTGTVEIKFKKSETIKKVSIYTGVSPRSSYHIKVQGLKNGEWVDIGEISGTLEATANLWETLLEINVEEGTYEGIKVDITQSSSWAGASEILVE